MSRRPMCSPASSRSPGRGAPPTWCCRTRPPPACAESRNGRWWIGCWSGCRTWRSTALARRGPPTETSAQGEPDRLLLGVLLERLEALVAAAEAGLLVAAERRRDVALGVGVDADGAGTDSSCDADRAVQVRRVDRRRQPVVGLVREGDRLVLVVERDDRDDRPENLLARDLHGVRDVVED